MIIDDYAHHPNEIKMTLNALRKITKNKLIAFFEPHRFSRINELKEGHDRNKQIKKGKLNSKNLLFTFSEAQLKEY